MTTKEPLRPNEAMSTEELRCDFEAALAANHGANISNFISRNFKEALFVGYQLARASLPEREGMVSDLLESLKHMQSCASCGVDSWEECEEGRKALAVIEQAEAALSTQKPVEKETGGENV